MSRIRADKIVNRAGTGAPELPFGVNAPNGLNVSGVVTATSYRGDGSQLTGIDASSLKDGSNVKVQATATGATVTGTLVADVSGNITSSGANTLGSLTVSNDATVQGNLTVNGTTTTIDTAVTAVDSLAVEGSVGIGTTNPSEKLEVRGGKIFIDGGGNRKITLDPGSNATYDSRIDASHTLVFRSYVDAGAGVKTCTFNTNGHLIPGDDNGQDLGASNARWRNIYTGDLNLSNEGSANDVDGTWGQYTIQEGEDDLFLINRRTGKKYKFNLTEVN